MLLNNVLGVLKCKSTDLMHILHIAAFTRWFELSLLSV